MKKNMNSSTKKISFCIVYFEIIIQIFILLYINNTKLTNFLLIGLIAISLLLCVIEVRKINVINLLLLIAIVGLMIISTLSGSGGWGATINSLILVFNILVISNLKFNMKQIKIVSYTFIIFFLFLILVSKKAYEYYINTDLFNYSLNPNVIAYLALLNSFYTFLIILKQKRYYKLKFLIAFVLNFYILYRTGSRTSLVGFLIFVVLYIISNKTKSDQINAVKFKRRIRLIILSSFVFVYMYAFLFPKLFFSNNFIFLNKKIFTGRELIWQEIYFLMKNNWLFGVGADYGFVNSKYYSAHNLFLGYAAIFGVPIMIFMILFIYRILTNSFVKNNNEYTKYLFNIWTIILIISIFETILMYSPTIIFTTSIFIFNISSEEIENNKNLVVKSDT